MGMLKATRFLIILALLAACSGTARETDRRTEKQSESELLSLHMIERRAHFEHDVQTLLTHVAPVLLDVRDGQTNRMSREDVRRRFVEYFKNAQFSAWDDVEPPIVHVSSDGKMGWMIVRVRIAYIETDVSGRQTNNDSVAAWMSAYEKQNGEWVMIAVTSTFSPG